MPVVNLPVPCVHCGASLEGVAVGGACTNCGRPAGCSIDLSHVDPDDWTIQSDLACCMCRYNVRTLRVDGNCPECGTSVFRTLLSGDLRFADPVWLQNMRRGIRLMLIGYGFASGVLLLGVATNALEAMTEAVLAITGVFVTLALAGHLFLCAPEPLASDTAATPWIKGAIRRCAVMVPLSGLLFMVADDHAVAARAMCSPDEGFWLTVGFCAGAGCYLGFTTVVLLTSIQLRRMALREGIRGRELAGISRVFVYVAGLTSLAWIMEAFLIATSLNPRSIMVEVYSCAMLLLGALVTFLGLMLLFGYYHLFSDAIAQQGASDRPVSG